MPKTTCQAKSTQMNTMAHPDRSRLLGESSEKEATHA